MAAAATPSFLRDRLLGGEPLRVRRPLPRSASWFLGAVLVLIALGLPLLFSASSNRGDYYAGDPFHHVTSQFKGVLLGAAALLTAASLNPRLWIRAALPLYVVTVGLLVALAIPGLGVERNSATRWLDLGFITFQPSEIAKLTIPLAIAWCVARFGVRGPERTGWGRGGIRNRALNGCYRLAQLGAVGLVALLVALGPDYGTALFILGVGGSLLLLSGMPFGYPFVGLLAVSPLGYVGFLGRRAELIERFQGLLDPEQVYQVKRSLFGFGSGGLSGKGFGQGMESYYLPEQHTDFIFSILGEELGLVGAVLVIAVFSLILQSGWRVARGCPDPALRVLAFAIVVNIVLQATINMAVTTAAAPTKGIPLPFVSFGSSGLTMFLLQVGILLAIARWSAGADERADAAAEAEEATA